MAEEGPEGSVLQRWSELILEGAEVNVKKRKAVKVEDFVEAGRMKRRAVEVEQEILAQRQMAGSASGLEEELARLEDLKQRAITTEDFAEASRLKKVQQALRDGDGDVPELAQSACVGARALLLSRGLPEAEENELIAELPAIGASVAKQEDVTSAPLGSSSGQRLGQPAQKIEAIPQVKVCTLKREDKPVSVSVKQEGGVTPNESAGFDEADGVPPGLALEQFLPMSNEELWQHAWATTWEEADSAGKADDEQALYARARESWKQWRAFRDRVNQRRANDEGRRKAEEILGASAAPSSAEKLVPEPQWVDQKAKADWLRAVSDTEKRKRALEEVPKTGRDLCALVKQRCPADQPIAFERLLAACPKGTTVRQLTMAMAKEPQEFRQNWDSREFCVRPANSRCVDWLPVQGKSAPKGFREEAALPDEMLSAAKTIFEERLKPQSQMSEDPLAQFLSAPGRLPPDTPLSFEDLLVQCPPDTDAMTLIRMMSKRRDTFRQSADGSRFCVRPRVKCRDWAAVNPYLNPGKM